MNLPSISVIVATKNEEKNIENCLKSISEQTYPRNKIEIIVVDNNSIDRTKEMAKKYTDKVYNKGPERSAQRNFGMIDIAKGKYAMFIDADMVLSQRLIEESVNKMEKNKDLVGLYVPLRWVGNNWIIKVKGFEREFYDATCLDAVRFIKRDVVVKMGGFDERLYAGEDWDLDKRTRKVGKVSIIKSKMYHHEDKDINLKEYFKKRRYYSNNMDVYIRKYGADDPDIKKQFGLWYRYFGVFMKNGKWKKLLRHPLLTLRLYLLKFMVGIQYLIRKRRRIIS